MGEFAAGRWAVIITIYFFFFFTLVWAIINGHTQDLSGIRFNDPGFSSQAYSAENGNFSDISFQDRNATEVDFENAESGYNSVWATLRIITGINSSNVEIGIPTAFRWIFSFVFFWIPFLMFLVCLYFILPFFH